MRAALVCLEVLLLSALILAGHCWNREQVFVGHDIYFTDADCYSRMTRARLCQEHPGRIIRHQDFENYPDGTTPHATAPFDYLILMLSVVIAPFSSNALELAGAWISPLLALAGGLFLLFWTNQSAFRYRWPALLLYAFSPILVHGTGLGRPDHQSLLIMLVLMGFAGECALTTKPSPSWAALTGFSWALALWVSLYEPLVLFVLAQTLWWFARRKSQVDSSSRKTKWIAFLVVMICAAAVERRLPSLSLFDQPLVRNWSGSIGELQKVPLFSSIWFQWGSLLLLIAPLTFLILSRVRRALLGQAWIFLCFMAALILLTMWQARWAYFLITVFVVALPLFLEPVKSRLVIWAVYLVCLWPVAAAWDADLWANEAVAAQREEGRREGIELRELALSMRSANIEPFLAPWWLSPELAYWSGQPGVAGSSHESFAGILASARFFASNDFEEARSILDRRGVRFVMAYDGERVARTTEKILGVAISPSALCYQLDRTPSQARGFLQLTGQNSSGKLYQTVNNR